MSAKGRRASPNSQSAAARRLAAKHSDAKSFVYFIGARRGAIKIGLSTTPHRRLKDIQSASPLQLEVLAVIPGDAEDEARIHEKLARHRLSGEWFRRCPEVVAEVELARRFG